MGIIGPNGAGKSTVFNMIAGSLQPTGGSLTFRKEDIAKLPPHKVAKKGIARVFQGNVLFANLSVIANVLIGLHLHTRLGPFGFVFGGPSARRREKALYERAMEILQQVGLSAEAYKVASSQSHGNQRLVCLAVALAADPALLLLDEPVTGMNTEEVQGMLATIKALRKEKGLTCIVVEHNMEAVMDLCDRIVAISFGRKIAEGSPAEIASEPVVIEAYLGAEEDAS